MDTAVKDVTSTKRRRKEPGDSRAERKRELDRIAQRATRERTKARIADLEQRLASLESGDKNTEIAQLTKTIGELRTENAKYQNALVKMRFAINEALDDFEGPTRRDSTQSISPGPELDLSRTNSMADPAPSDMPIVHPAVQADAMVATTNSFHSPTQAQRLQALYDTQGYRPAAAHEFGNIDINQIFEFFEYGSSNPFAHPSPLTGRISSAGGYHHIAPRRAKVENL